MSGGQGPPGTGALCLIWPLESGLHTCPSGPSSLLGEGALPSVPAHTAPGKSGLGPWAGAARPCGPVSLESGRRAGAPAGGLLTSALRAEAVPQPILHLPGGQNRHVRPQSRSGGWNWNPALSPPSHLHLLHLASSTGQQREGPGHRIYLSSPGLGETQDSGSRSPPPSGWGVVHSPQDSPWFFSFKGKGSGRGQ